MQKKNQPLIAFSLLKGFLRYKPNLWIIALSLVLLAAFYLIFLKTADLNLYPDHHHRLRIDFYNDSIDGGNSKIEQYSISDTAISISFTLMEGFVRPYVGISFTEPDNSPVDIMAYNQIQIVARGQDIKNIVIYLITKNANARAGMRFPDLHFGNNIEVTNERHQFNLYLNQFKVPDWWNDVNNIPPDRDQKPDWKHLLHINLTNGLAPTVDTKRLLQIYSIKFVRNNNRNFIKIGIAELCLIMILLALYAVRMNKRRRIPVTITYKPVDADRKSRQQGDFLGYIHENFHDEKLSLDRVSEASGISQRRIANFISEKYDCNFKTYVNQIRINEAKRLLKASDLNISEIAYKVGFSSPNNFNRVFKNFTGKSPSEYAQDKD